MLQIGDCTIQNVLEQEFEPSFDFLFPELAKDALEPDRDWLAPEHVDLVRGVVRLAIQSFIVKSENQTILVDTGIGENKNRHRPEWHKRIRTGFLNDLRKKGVDPTDIDLVVCTHIHVDHVGWNTQFIDGRWQQTFPNARYVFPKAERLHVLGLPQKPAFFLDSVAPLPDHLVDWVEPHLEIGRGIALVPLPGHSPGMVGVRIDSEGHSAILCSDALHSPFQVLHPHISSTLCTDPDLARITRQTLLQNCVDEQILLIPAHLRVHPAMRIVKTERGFHPVFVSSGNIKS